MKRDALCKALTYKRDVQAAALSIRCYLSLFGEDGGERQNQHQTCQQYLHRYSRCLAIPSCEEEQVMILVALLSTVSVATRFAGDFYRPLL